MTWSFSSGPRTGCPRRHPPSGGPSCERRNGSARWNCGRDDPAALHDALMSLPMAPWLDVTVEALAQHPQERS
jgi:hypothetical protein